MGTCNRCVKIAYEFSTVCEKKIKKMSGPLGGFFLTHTVFDIAVLFLLLLVALTRIY